MSSGACRALAALLLTIVAVTAMALPVAAADDRLRENALITYDVVPEDGRIRVAIVLRFATAGNRAFPAGTWGPVYLEERAVGLRTNEPDFVLASGSTNLPGPWVAKDLDVPRIEVGATDRTRIVYTIDGRIDNNAAALSSTPARVGDAYVYFCVVGQAVDNAEVRVTLPDRFTVTQEGTRLDEIDRGLGLTSTSDPGRIFTCIEAVDETRLQTDEFFGPGDRRIVLQAWPESNWLGPARRTVEPELRRLHEFLDLDIPGTGAVIIREAPPRTVGGFASAHATPGVVQLDEEAGVVDPAHEMAHVWFGATDYPEQWMREGLAAWSASASREAVCPAVDGSEASLDLSDWQVIEPTAPNDVEERIEAQEAAACGIMGAVAARMGDEAWHGVLGAMLRGETKYIGRDGPTQAASTVVDYKEWLDAVDERGLVPAGETDLDFAQNLLLAYGIPTDAEELAARSEARARYHEFLNQPGSLGAPRVVRQYMDNWFFSDAMLAMDKAQAVHEALTEADALLPVAGFIPVIQPLYEAADSVEALDNVLAQAEILKSSAVEVIEPLGELLGAAPPGWEFPAVLRGIITNPNLNVEQARAAVDPSVEIVRELVEADAALPEAGLLDRYRARYESTASIDALEEMADAVGAERVAAELTGAALSVLRDQAGEWVIPDAVTSPIERGQLAAAQEIVENARGVVAAAREADAALPEANISAEIRPRFEAVTTATEMAALRRQAQSVRNDAVAVGDALNSLRARAPDFQIPAVVSVPVEARDFATAAQVARAAQRWIEAADKTDQALEGFGAMERIKEPFESAQSLQELLDGAGIAENWATGAAAVAEAERVVAAPRDLMANLGLWGTDVAPDIEAAREAAIAGNVELALGRSSVAIETIRNGSSSGALRLTGLIFFAVAILGVLGMWFIFRRQRGPSWARQTTPHWMKSGEEPRQLKSGNEPKRDDRPPSNSRAVRRR